MSQCCRASSSSCFCCCQHVPLSHYNVIVYWICVYHSLSLSLFLVLPVCASWRFIVSHINSGRLVGDVATATAFCIRFLQFLACKSLTCFYLMPFWCGAKKLPLAFIAVIKWWKMFEIRIFRRKATYAYAYAIKGHQRHRDMVINFTQSPQRARGGGRVGK